MSDNLELLKLIPDKTLVAVMLKIKPTDTYSKVAIMISRYYADYEFFTILDLAQELARRLPTTNDDEVML